MQCFPCTCMCIICTCNHLLAQVSPHCLAVSLPSSQPARPHAAFRARHRGQSRLRSPKRLFPPNAYFPLMHKKNPPFFFGRAQHQHTSSQFTAKCSWFPGSGTQRSAQGAGKALPAELEQPSGLGNLPLRGCRGVSCSSSSTAGGTGAMLGCCWAQGLPH